MTTEQKEAISIIDKMIKSYIEADECGLSNNDFKHEIKAMQTALNLIQEKDKEIEKYKKLYQKALDDAVVTAHDNMQKDKIIDELAKAFKQDDARSVEEIKQYFERKVEDENR